MIPRTILSAALAGGGLLGLCGCTSDPVAPPASSLSPGTSYYPYHTGATYRPAGESARPGPRGEVIAVRKHYPPGVYPIRSAGSVHPAATGATSPAGTYPVTVQRDPRLSPSALLHQVGVRADYMPRSARGRRDASRMRPRYITIHSTQNWSRGADAWRHSLALKRSKLGRLSWHYTVDEKVAVQHLPTTITGNHADYDGPGNRYSIGIEMCEHPGNSRAVTVDRTAKLAAFLMEKYDIPLSRVVPHYHWPREGHNPPNKNCPHFLLDRGRPGSKWRGFLGKVNTYHRAITLPQSDAWASR